MPLIDPKNSTLLVIDAQARLMPAIHEGQRVAANIGRLMDAAALLEQPVLVTEQSPDKLGGTVPELAGRAPVIAKTSFDCCGEPAFLEAIAGDAELIVSGCEAHVCVGQTVLSLLEMKRRVVLVADAVGSRVPESRQIALERMARHGAEIVTTEMVLFEWLRDAGHPRFREVSKLIR